MVGDLYPEGDARRDGAFTIFYMGINAGAFLAPLVCSTLGEDPASAGRYGYFAAGVGMMLSVIIQLLFVASLPRRHRRRCRRHIARAPWRVARRSR